MYIGDGSNDVLALQHSEIGVGIKGTSLNYPLFFLLIDFFLKKIGTDGALAAIKADFAIKDFNQLVDLVFVLGRRSYLQCSLVRLDFISIFRFRFLFRFNSL